jgi:hypothetical protein
MKTQINNGMKTKVKKILQETTVNIFEDICFMYLMPELENIQRKLKLEAAAEAKYRGDYTGKLLIETRGGLLSAIAANILSNEVPSSRQKRDALEEIANIICGNIVMSLGRRGRGYRIESPRSLNKAELLKEEDPDKPIAEVTLNFNEGRADVKFFIDGYSSLAQRIKG